MRLPPRSQMGGCRVALCREPVDRPLNASQPVVQFDDVSYSVGGRLILNRLNLDVKSGEPLVLLGRSGSGKTTALRMVNGLLFPTSGRVLVNGKATTEWDLIRLRRGIGYVIQEVG